MIAFDFVLDRTAVTIRAWSVDESLLDKPTGERVQFGCAARPGDPAASDPAVGFDLEHETHSPPDSRFAKVPGIVAGGDFAGDLFKIGSTAILAIAFAALPSA